MFVLWLPLGVLEARNSLGRLNRNQLQSAKPSLNQSTILEWTQLNSIRHKGAQSIDQVTENRRRLSVWVLRKSMTCQASYLRQVMVSMSLVIHDDA